MDKKEIMQKLKEMNIWDIDPAQTRRVSPEKIRRLQQALRNSGLKDPKWL